LDSYTIESNKKKSRIPARLDFLQSGTGLILGVFIWMHLLFDSSIILGKRVFSFVSGTLEFSFLSDTGHGFPIAVVFAVLAVSLLFITHALLGIRKFPISWKQHRVVRDQMQMLDHSETKLWYIQVLTGFLMFFTGSVHLYTMLTNPGSIGPYMSADRIVSEHMWLLYIVLLICVVLHGNIGLYRLCMKWGWFSGKDARKSRLALRKLKNKLIIFYMTIGILALLVFVVIGINHRDKVGERYKGHVTKAEITNDIEVTQPVQESNEPVDIEHAEGSNESEEIPLDSESQELENVQDVEELHE
jgi:fumarate reductase subunit C